MADPQTYPAIDEYMNIHEEGATRWGIPAQPDGLTDRHAMEHIRDPYMTFVEQRVANPPEKGG